MADAINYLHLHGILHRNITIDSFHICEDSEGNTTIKLSNNRIINESASYMKTYIQSEFRQFRQIGTFQGS